MKEIAKEIFIRTVAAVLAIVIVFVLFEIYARMQEPCGCKDKDKPKILPGAQPEALAEQAQKFNYNPFGTIFA